MIKLYSLCNPCTKKVREKTTVFCCNLHTPFFKKKKKKKKRRTQQLPLRPEEVKHKAPADILGNFIIHSRIVIEISMGKAMEPWHER